MPNSGRRVVVRRVNPYGNSCTVTLDLPWDVAELIADHGPEIVAAVAEAVAARHRDVERNEALQRLSEISRRQNKHQWAEVGRLASQEIRRNRTLPRRQSIIDVAERYGLNPTFVDNLAVRHERERRQRLKQRRDREIIRLYFRGHSNPEIAEQLSSRRRPVSASTVAKVLHKHGDLIAALPELFNHTFGRIADRRDAASGKPDTDKPDSGTADFSTTLRRALGGSHGR